MWKSILRGVIATTVLIPLVAPTAAHGQATSRPVSAPRIYAITGVRIVIGTGEVIETGTIIISDGLFTAVNTNVDAPDGVWTFDGTGLTAYPGLIDSLTSLALAEELRQPAGRGGGGFGGSGNRENHSWGPEDRPATSTWVNAADHLDASDSRIPAWRKAGFTTVVTVPERGLLPGQAALINLAGERPNDMVVQTPVAQRAKFTRGPGFSGYPNSLMGSIAYIKQVFIDAAHYERAWSIYAASPGGLPRPRYDRALEPLRATLNDGGPVLMPADRAKEIQRVANLAQEISVSPILYGGHGSWEIADEIAASDIPILVSLDWPRRSPNGDPEAEEALQVLRFRDRAPTSPAALHKAGATFAFYSGSSQPDQLLANARLAVRAGLPSDAALRALTLGAAELFGVADQMGSIEVGKIANLVLTDGDLFTAGTKPLTVIVDGHRFEFDDDSDIADVDNKPVGERSERRQSAVEEEDGPYDPVPMTRNRGPIRNDRMTLIRNATVMTVSHGNIENGSILIQDGKIAAIGSDLDAPSGAHVIDASGKFVIPGIIDAHSHIAAEAINEGAVAISAMVGIDDVLDPDDQDIYRALAGGVTTINILHGSANPIGGKNAVIKLRWGSDAEGLRFEGAQPGIKFALGENTKRDRNPDRYPNSRMGVNDIIRQAFIEAQEYRDAGRRYEQMLAAGNPDAIPPRRNLKLDPLVEIMEGTRLVHAHSYRADEILQLLRAAEEFGFRIATLQHVLEGYRVADEIAEHGAGASTFSDWWAYKVEAYEAIPHNAALMNERGVLVSINSDSGEEMRHLNQEASKAVKWGGASRDDALAMVTLNPARQLRIDDRVGSIEVGKDADLVIYTGNPLSVYGIVEMTFLDGKVYFDRKHDLKRRTALAAEIEQLMERQPNRPAPRIQVEETN